MPNNGSSISERARNAATADPQEGFFDREVGDDALERLLDERADKKHKQGLAKKAFTEKDDLVRARLGEYELGDGEVARCGKYRIEKRATAGGHRSFEVSPSSRLTITLFD